MDSNLSAVILGGTFGIVTALINKGIFTPKRVEYAKDGILDAHIDNIGHRYGCERVYIVGYHNGGFWADGTSIKKFTIKHEYYNAQYTQATITSLQSVSTGILKEIPGILMQDNILFEADIEKSGSTLLTKPAYFKVLREYGTCSTLAVAIKKRIFNWRKFRVETVMIASLHFNWGPATKLWAEQLLKADKACLSISNDVTIILDMFDTRHVKFDILETLLQKVDKVKQTLSR